MHHFRLSPIFCFLQIIQWILCHTVDVHLKVYVRPCASSRASYVCYMLSLIYLLSLGYYQLAAMCIVGLSAVSMTDDHQVSVRAFIAGKGYSSSVRCRDLRSTGTGQVDPLVGASPPASKLGR